MHTQQVEQLNEQINLLRMRDNVSQPSEAATPKGKIQVCVYVSSEPCLWDKVVPRCELNLIKSHKTSSWGCPHL